MQTTSTMTTPQSLLEAVNELLRLARVGRIQSLSGTETSVDASGAKTALDSVVREVLLRGWEFNTERGTTLLPDNQGIINLPLNALRVYRAKYQSSDQRLFVRKRQLYDNKKHTFIIGEPAIVDMLVVLSFEELPEEIKLLVTATAAFRWCPTKLPSGTTFTITDKFLNDCELRAMQAEVDDLAEEDLKQTSPHFAFMARRR